MPGFLLTFILIGAAGAWGRFLSERIEASWPLYLPGLSMVIWLLIFVFAAVTMITITGTAQDMETDGTKLYNLQLAGVILQNLSIGTLLVMVPVTVVVYRQQAR